MSTIRVDRITPYQSGSVAIEGLNITNLTIDGTLTASLQQGYVWVGNSAGRTTTVPTSSFGGGGGSDITALNSFTASQQVLNTTFATTGSNTFAGNQNIQGTITASIAQGFALVGGVGNVSTLVATSSFGGALPSGVVSGSSQLTASYDARYALSGSVGTAIATGSFATTGSNTFRGTETISGSILVSGSVNADGFELDGSTTTTIPVLNTTFDATFSSSEHVTINKSLVLGNGKVLVAGRFESIDGHTTNDIARFNSDGTIDTGFTSPVFGGYFGGDAGGFINTFVTQSDNKIIVAGNFGEVNGDGNRMGLARLNANGTLDNSFTSQSWGSFGEVRDIAIQSDGKIVCVGDFTSGSRRINTNGTLDTSFDISQGNNQALSFNNGNFYSVALLDSGSEQAILIGGDFVQWGSYSYPYLVKLNPNGTLDFGFAGNNLDLITGGDYTDRIEKIKVGDDGNIYISGKFRDTGIGNHAGFARVTPDDQGNGVGALDNGFRTYISGSFVNDFDFYDGDKILLGGNFTTFGNPGFFTTSANRFVIIDQNDGGLVNNWITDTLSAKYVFSAETSVNRSVDSVTLLPDNNVLAGGPFTLVNGDYRTNGGLASLKLTGYGDVTTTSEYTITADSTRLLVSSSTTQFSGDVNIVGNVTASEFSGSFVGDGSGLTGLSTINTGSFATTGSNTFKGEQIISSSLIVTNEIKGTGSIFLQPDVNDGRKLEIYNTAATDVHIKSNGGLTFLGDDSNYVLIDASTEKISITGPNGVVVSGSLNVSGSNTFVGNQIISGSVRVSGSISQRGIGNGNIIIGEDPLTNLNSTAEFNTIIGADAGALLRSGSNNVFIGKMAGLLTQDSTGNVFIGSTAGYSAKAEQNIYIGESAGFSNISGRYNVAIGHQAGYNNKVDLNTFIGWQSGFQNTSGSGNTFVGERTGESNTIGNNNSFFGGSSGRENSVGNNNTFIGQNAGQQNTSGSSNTFVGSQAGSYTTTGGNNTFVGEQAGILNTIGYSNAFFGDNSGYRNTTAYENTFIGSFSGYENKTGVENTFVGTSAGQNNGVGSDNTYIGHRAGNSNISGSNNTLVGKSAGFDNAVGNRNTLLGTEAGYVATSGDDNLMLGYRAGAITNNVQNLTNSNTSIFLGSDARGVNNASNQIVIGALAEGNGSNTTTIGNSSTIATYLRGTLITSGSVAQQVTGSFQVTGSANIVGNSVLSGSLTVSGSIRQTGIGTNNTFIGNNTGENTDVSTGIWNTFVGSQAGKNNTFGSDNTFMGANAGVSSSNAIGNTFVGSGTGRKVIEGEYNSFFGVSAGGNNGVGNYNTFIGSYAADTNISGSNSVVMGFESAKYAANGSTSLFKLDNSVFIGHSAKANANSETNQIVIGYDAIGNGSNTTTIGNSSTTATYLKGTLNVSTAILAQVSSSYNFVDDAAAATGGVPLGGLYHTSGSIKIRLA